MAVREGRGDQSNRDLNFNMKAQNHEFVIQMLLLYARVTTACIQCRESYKYNTTDSIKLHYFLPLFVIESKAHKI